MGAFNAVHLAAITAQHGAPAGSCQSHGMIGHRAMVWVICCQGVHLVIGNIGCGSQPVIIDPIGGDQG